MTDTFTPKQRARIMAKVRSKNTKPEMIVRHLVYSSGYRYRLHCKDLPGSPDLVFRGKRKAIFVHGCFWHGHDCRAGLNKPSSNQNYWKSKLERNVMRDRASIEKLGDLGWKTLILWECEIRNIDNLEQKISNFMNN